MKYSNVFYVSHFNVIGGIETFIYELVKKYSKEDITIVYSAETSDRKQLKRIRKYARVIRQPYNAREKIKCNKLFTMYVSNIDLFEADEVIQLVHADYKRQKLRPNKDKRINEYYAVSKEAAKSYEYLINKKVGVCYNPIKIEKPKKVLKLISATRLTKEKGLDRMKYLTYLLDQAGVPYMWLVFTNQKDAIKNPNVIYMEPRLDIRDYIAEADYLVQLSDVESMCYSVCESLELKTPVIVTPCPVFKELGIKNKEHGYIVPFDMSNISIEEIYNNIPKKFSFKTPSDIYDKLLVKGKKTYKPSKLVTATCIKPYYDMEFNMHIQKGNKLPEMIFEDRAEELKEKGLIEYV